jgi:hypothetical protein
MALNEDFTTYDVTDGGSTYTVTASRVTYDDMERGETSHVSKDIGSGFFNADFVHEFEMEMSNLVGGSNMAAHWGMANVQKDMKSVEDDGDDAEWFYHHTANFYVACVDAGVSDVSSALLLTQGTHYYVRITRDDDGGSNNAGLVTADVFTGGFDQTLVGSISAEHTTQHDFRYVYASASHSGFVGGQSSDGFTENLDLHPTQNYTREDSSALASNDTDLSTDFSTSDYKDVAS